jgi:NADH:ubiquinone oxidoreductase subunit 4 (chain M)
MGFIMLGLFAMSAISIDGSVIQLLNHGIATGALFLFVGMLYERMHTRQIKDFGGIAKKSSYIYRAFYDFRSGVGRASGVERIYRRVLNISRRFPQLSGLDDYWRKRYYFCRRLFIMDVSKSYVSGVTNPAAENFEDMNLREIITVLPLIILMFLIGFYPMPFLERIDPTVLHFLSAINHHKTVYNLIKLKTGLSNA